MTRLVVPNRQERRTAPRRFVGRSSGRACRAPAAGHASRPRSSPWPAPSPGLAGHRCEPRERRRLPRREAAEFGHAGDDRNWRGSEAAHRDLDRRRSASSGSAAMRVSIPARWRHLAVGLNLIGRRAASEGQARRLLRCGSPGGLGRARCGPARSRSSCSAGRWRLRREGEPGAHPRQHPRVERIGFGAGAAGLGKRRACSGFTPTSGQSAKVCSRPR